MSQLILTMWMRIRIGFIAKQISHAWNLGEFFGVGGVSESCRSTGPEDREGCSQSPPQQTEWHTAFALVLSGGFFFGRLILSCCRKYIHDGSQEVERLSSKLFLFVDLVQQMVSPN